MFENSTQTCYFLCLIAISFYLKVTIVKDQNIPNNTNPIPDHSPIVEPFFWGTGDLLTWETGELMQAIDREHLFRNVWGKGCLSDKQYVGTRDKTFLPLFNKLSAQISDTKLIDPRGFYGYFPVIVDGAELILLDPSDFHSELLSVVFRPEDSLGGRTYADYFRSEGDCIGFSITTLGVHLDNYLNELNDDPEKEGYYLKGFGSVLLQLLNKKIVTEMRRGLGILDSTGRAFSLSANGTYYYKILPRLFELLSVEERLGIVVKDNSTISPDYSEILLYIHHPSIKNL
jgi:5-methyltetrahydrofolate--homocysteine methyltransferase